MKLYPFIEAEEVEQRNVSAACRLLEVSRSAYYSWWSFRGWGSHEGESPWRW